MAIAKKKTKNQKELIDALLGKTNEPFWDKDYPCSRLELMRAFTWYNENKNDKDACKYLKCSTKHIKSFLTVAWCERMISRGFILPEKENQTYLSKKKELLSLVKSEKNGSEKDNSNNVVISIQDRIQIKANEYIAELEGMVDEFGIRGNAKELNAYEWMVNNEVKAAHANKIAEYFKTVIVEPLTAESGKDEFLTEAYGAYTKNKLRNLILCISSIIKDAEKIANNQKIARKPRKKKTVSAEKKIANIKYLMSFDELKLQSVNPVKIIGCQQLWTYNVKTKKLGVYNSKDESGLSVRGSSIDNFDRSSICKTLRDPEKSLQKVLSSGKIPLRKIMGELKTKQSEMTGRINKDTILLRII